MNCYQCGGVYEAKSDSLEIFDFYVGKIEVRGIPYYQCRDCHDILYTEEMSHAIETERNRRIHELLYQLPLGDFVSSIEAASILGVSRQALHKNRRINHGFIYQTKFAGVTVYLRESVLRFKRKGDGRFPLQPNTYSPSTQHSKRDISSGIPASYEPIQTRTDITYPFLKKERLSLKEHSYAIRGKSYTTKDSY
jgi:hypothetical protein